MKFLKNLNKSLLNCVVIGSVYFSNSYAQTLEDAVQLTINENPEIQEARSVKMAYAQEIKQAASKYYPTLDISAGYGLEQANNFNTRGRGIGTSQLGRTDSSVLLQQMIFDGFQTPNEVARVTAKTDAQAYTVFGQSEITGLQATQAYIDVLRREALLVLAEENLSLHKGFYEQIKIRTQRGIGRISDLDQATGRLARAETNLQAEQGNLKDAQTAYLRVIGVLPTQLRPAPVPAKAIPASLEEATELALAEHPTLKAANADINESLAQHNSASAPFYPKLNFAVEYDNNYNQSGIRGPTEDLTAMARISYNLFNGGKDQARRNQTAYEMGQAKSIRDNTYRQVVESIRLAWVAHKTLSSQIAFFKSHRDASAKALNAYRQQFNVGQRTLLDLLDSTNEMYLANLAYTDAKYNELTARYRILAGMGRLNKYLGITLPSEVKPITPDKKQTEVVFTAANDNEMMHEFESDIRPYQKLALETTENSGSIASHEAVVAAENAPSAVPEQVEHLVEHVGPDAIKQRLQAWSEAWSSGDVGAYLSFYNENFTPDSTVNHEDWKHNRISRISSAKQIQISISDLRVEQDKDNGIFKTFFHQTYNAHNYHDETDKRIIWRKVKDAWLIEAENTIESQLLPK